jgi:hypothetical protein
LTDEDSPSVFDAMHLFGTGGLDSTVIKVTLEDLNVNDFEKMAYDQQYASEV